MPGKYRTLEQVKAAQKKASTFASNVLGNDDLRDELADLTPQEYASRKGLVITNPQRRAVTVANGDATKGDLQDMIDQVTDILTDAYEPEVSREDLASAVGEALDALQGIDTDDSDDTDDDDSYSDAD